MVKKCFSQSFSYNTKLRNRSSHKRCSIKKSCFYKFRKILKKTPLSERLFFNQVTGLKFFNFIKKMLQNKCFPGNITKFKRTIFLKNICEWLLLTSVVSPGLIFYGLSSNGRRVKTFLSLF